MKISQFESAVASSGYRPANLRFAPATNPSASPSESTFDLRRRSTLWLALRNSTSGFHRLLSSPAQPSNRPSTCVSDRPSGAAFELNLQPSSGIASSSSAFRLSRDLRREPTLRLCLAELNLRLSPAAVVSGSSFLSPFDLRRRPTFQPCLRTQPPDSHRISHPPAQPLNQLVTCVANQPSSLALRNSTSGLHRLSHLRLRLPIVHGLSPSANLPALPLNSTSDVCVVIS